MVGRPILLSLLGVLVATVAPFKLAVAIDVPGPSPEEAAESSRALGKKLRRQARSIGEEAQQSDQADQVRQRAREIIEERQKQNLKAWTEDQAGKPEASGSAKAQEKDPEKGRVLVLMTMADKSRAKGVLKSLAGQDQVRVLLRGMPEGARSLGQTMAQLKALVKGIESAPRMGIDPRPFRAIGASVAPTIAYQSGDEILAWARGIINTGWLREQVQAGKRGDLGKYGEVIPIEERDFTQTMISRAKKVDWKEQARRAREDFFRDRTPVRIPDAQEPRRRTVDPRMVAQKTIKTPRGKVIARKGETFNPIHEATWDVQVIAFDGRQKGHRQTARRMAERVRSEGYRPILVTTAPPEPEWRSFRKMEKAFEEPIYLLRQHLAQRLRLKRLPARVWADEERGLLVIQERPPQ